MGGSALSDFETPEARIVAALPARLRALREARMSRRQLSALTGIEVTLLRRIESTQTPSLEQVLSIARALGIAPWELFGPRRYGFPGKRVRRGAEHTTESEWSVPATAAASPRPVRQVIPVGKQDAGVRHDGVEWILVQTGAVEVSLHSVGLTDEPVVLTEGDELDFDASVEHVVVNVGTEPAVLYRLFDASGLAAHTSAVRWDDSDMVADDETREWRQAAALRVSSVGFHEIRLGWLAKFVVPNEVQVEVVDIGQRAKIVSTRRDEQVAIQVDFLANKRSIENNGATGSPLYEFTDDLADAMQADYSPNAPGDAKRVEAERDSAEWFELSTTRWLLDNDTTQE